MPHPQTKTKEAKARHTKGPWEVGRHRPYIVACVREEHRSGNSFYISAGQPTGGSGWPADGIAGKPIEEFHANARLISCSPDYHAAAVAMIERHDARAKQANFEQCGCDDCTPFRAIVQKAEAGQ